MSGDPSYFRVPDPMDDGLPMDTAELEVVYDAASDEVAIEYGELPHDEADSVIAWMSRDAAQRLAYRLLLVAAGPPVRQEQKP